MGLCVYTVPGKRVKLSRQSYNHATENSRLKAARGLQMAPQRAVGNANSVFTPSERVGCQQFLSLCVRGTFPGGEEARTASIQRGWTGGKLDSRFQVAAPAPIVAREQLSALACRWRGYTVPGQRLRLSRQNHSLGAREDSAAAFWAPVAIQQPPFWHPWQVSSRLLSARDNSAAVCAPEGDTRCAP